MWFLCSPVVPVLQGVWFLWHLSPYCDPGRGVLLPHFADGDSEALEGKQGAQAEAAGRR